MVGRVLMRDLVLTPPYSCPLINPTFLSKKDKDKVQHIAETQRHE